MRPSDSVKSKAAQRFLGKLNYANRQTVQIYETEFFNPLELAHMSQADAQMVKRHLLDALASRPTDALVAKLHGIAEHLDEADATHLVRSFVQALWDNHDSELDDEIADLIHGSLPLMQADVERCVVTLLTREKQQAQVDGSAYFLRKFRRALGEPELEPQPRADDLEDLPF